MVLGLSFSRPVVRLAGEGDVTTGALRGALRAGAALRPRLLAVELSGLSFTGSWVLRVVVGGSPGAGAGGPAGRRW
jgi:anti-anti-sigma regulatory factor